METQTCGPPARTRSGRDQSELGQRSGPARLDHDVGTSEQVVQDPDAIAVPKIERHGLLAPVQQVEELGWAPARAIGSLRRLDLDDRGADAGEEVAAQWARPQRREVDDDLAGQVGSRRRFAKLRPDNADVSCRLADARCREAQELGPRQEQVRVTVLQVGGDG